MSQAGSGDDGAAEQRPGQQDSGQEHQPGDQQEIERQFGLLSFPYALSRRLYAMHAAREFDRMAEFETALAETLMRCDDFREAAERLRRLRGEGAAEQQEEQQQDAAVGLADLPAKLAEIAQQYETK